MPTSWLSSLQSPLSVMTADEQKSGTSPPPPPPPYIPSLQFNDSRNSQYALLVLLEDWGYL